MAGYTPLTDGDRDRMLALLGIAGEEELLETGLASEGTTITVDVRGKRRVARVSSKPLFP